MWTVIYIASSRQLAERLKNALTEEGLLVQLRATGSTPMGDSGSFELLVPESEAEEAHEIISGALSS